MFYFKALSRFCPVWMFQCLLSKIKWTLQKTLNTASVTEIIHKYVYV